MKTKLTLVVLFLVLNCLVVEGNKRRNLLFNTFSSSSSTNGNSSSSGGSGGVNPADSFPLSLRTVTPGGTWTNSGCTKNPDSVTTIFAVMDNTATAADINTAIGNCPSNQIVLLTNKTFSSLGDDLKVFKDGVVLSGMTNANGFPTTVLNGGKIYMNRTSSGAISGLHYPSPSEDTITAQNITAGLTAGSTSITLSANANSEFAVGDLFCIDQTDNNTTVRPSTTGLFHRTGRSYVVVVRCTSKSGAVLGFEPPLVGAYWSAGQSPQAWGWSSYLGGTLKSAGVRDIKFIGGASVNMVEAGPIYDCWIKNLWITVGSSGAGSARIRLAYSLKTTVTENIIPDTNPGSTSSYAFYPTVASFCEFTHNIVTNFQLFIPSIAMSSSFIGYNAGIAPYPDPGDNFLYEFAFPHGGHDHDNNYEGNWLANFYADSIFLGNSGNSGIIRNRIIGWDTGKAGNRTPIVLDTNMVNYTILGNVLGANEFHTLYSQMYAIHATVTGTIKTNNYNVVDKGVNSTETEVNGNTTSTSYRYSSKPARWGDTECPWPSYSPTLQSSTNTLGYTNIPAGFRARFGFWPSG